MPGSIIVLSASIRLLSDDKEILCHHVFYQPEIPGCYWIYKSKVMRDGCVFPLHEHDLEAESPLALTTADLDLLGRELLGGGGL